MVLVCHIDDIGHAKGGHHCSHHIALPFVGQTDKVSRHISDVKTGNGISNVACTHYKDDSKQVKDNQ